VPLDEVVIKGLPAGVSVDLVTSIVARITAAGVAAWPEVVISDALIAARIAAQLRDVVGGEPPAFDARHDADLYLATALGAANPAALRVFEAKLVPEIAIALRRLRLPGGTTDEVTQALRFELLVNEGTPKILDYAGRGELAAWVRVTATRKALKLARKAGRDETLDEVLLEHWPDATPDPQGKHLRSTYTAELKAAIKGAFAALAVRQRNLLRQHILDELTIDDLARLYRVHRATCARWLADARADLARNTRKQLSAALGLPSSELDSMLRFLDSDIELSISRILQSR
jgi:RNA polymerase sigma-70 factor (ECF subfamily)